ncbi:helix-turn-helix domain-containing protein [Longibaculum muris]|uniref:helix-turn-helix domain-containing protein n=1 Tax=Longibaculum muris TaxID=1796628 RepID=UPI0022E016D1|nr:helix-turn-helix transcriptional regulator [Longibaculum muris]
MIKKTRIILQGEYQYDYLWKYLKSKNISQNSLIREYGISTSQLHRLRINQVIYTSALDRLCNILECDSFDIVEYIPDNKKGYFELTYIIYGSSIF